MIPTTYRAKLAKHLSYPIGAEAISLALAGTPHVDEIDLCFYSRPVDPASRFQRVLAESVPYPILVAQYQPARRPGRSAAHFTIEWGWYEPHWEVTVFPVLRELRHVANALLRERGLPALRAWLKKAEDAARGMLTERIELRFDPAARSLTEHATSDHYRSKV